MPALLGGASIRGGVVQIWRASQAISAQPKRKFSRIKHRPLHKLGPDPFSVGGND